ncbi:dCTP deaminase domain-containing protein [Clostridium sp.]|uniref:dCTP deaminase domain-containing protein n=1 Tax=Clostridium sp. TaxID=1506 RepID=UPI0039909A52
MINIYGSILSNKDILKLMGKKICIYPFEEKNLQNASYDLTASIIAYKIDRVTVTSDNGNVNELEIKKSLINEDKQIVIDSGVTAHIQSNEAISISKKICGTYHAKVELCMKGLSPISTTLDPGYIGTSLISLHNYSDSRIILNIGEPIVSVMFYFLRNSCNIKDSHVPCRLDIEGIKIEQFDDPKLSKHACKGEKCVNFTKCFSSNLCGNIIDSSSLKIKREILKEMKEWSQQGWRTNFVELKRLVVEERQKRDKELKIKLLSIVINCLLIGSLAALIFFIWLHNISGETIQFKVIITIIGIMPGILKCIEGAIKNFIEK